MQDVLSSYLHQMSKVYVLGQSKKILMSYLVYLGILGVKKRFHFLLECYAFHYSLMLALKMDKVAMQKRSRTL